jgi:hypothetical protein
VGCASATGFIAGNKSTSLMLLELVKNMVRRSMPTPQPPVGGRPYSRDVQKFSSTAWASSSPAALSYFRFVLYLECVFYYFYYCSFS